MNLFANRIARAQEAMRAQSIAAAVIAPTDQMRYLIGWREEPHERFLCLLLPADSSPVLLVPALNEDQAKRNPAGINEIIPWKDSPGWQDIVYSLFRQWKINGRTIAIDDELPAMHLLSLQRLAPYARYITTGSWLDPMRAVKSSDELELLRRSASVADAVYRECLYELKEGMTEIDLKEVIDKAFRKRGAVPAFIIACFGPNSALPHHEPDQTRLKPGDIVLVDIGCTLDGYCSDITRVCSFGEAPEETAHLYDLVYNAHRAAYNAVKPGISCQDVDSAARAVINEAGYGERFFHRTGHGIGLSVHEKPYIVENNEDKLVEGMCFSIEPGVYLSDLFGIRIENIVTVTESGVQYLNSEPPDHLINALS
jgi:Xaa-Pro aminopeptidase